MSGGKAGALDGLLRLQGVNGGGSRAARIALTSSSGRVAPAEQYAALAAQLTAGGAPRNRYERRAVATLRRKVQRERKRRGKAAG